MSNTLNLACFSPSSRSGVTLTSMVSPKESTMSCTRRQSFLPRESTCRWSENWDRLWPMNRNVGPEFRAGVRTHLRFEVAVGRDPWSRDGGAICQRGRSRGARRPLYEKSTRRFTVTLTNCCTSTRTRRCFSGYYKHCGRHVRPIDSLHRCSFYQAPREGEELVKNYLTATSNAPALDDTAPATPRPNEPHAPHDVVQNIAAVANKARVINATVLTLVHDGNFADHVHVEGDRTLTETVHAAGKDRERQSRFN